MLALLEEGARIFEHDLTDQRFRVPALSHLKNQIGDGGWFGRAPITSRIHAQPQEVLGDSHKVRQGKKRSKANVVRLGMMASGLWLSPLSVF